MIGNSDVRPPSDAELIEAVRDGSAEAYASLYERHVRAARNLAAQLSYVDADDLVSDAFAKVLTVLRAGGGPEAAFRPYLLTAVRNLAYDKTRRDRRVELAGDVEEVPGAARVTSTPFRDTAVAELDQALAATAFKSLPERWQTVLWHTAIEGQSPGEIAPLLGLTANGVSAVAHRAREGLRRAYLQAHVAHRSSERCRATAAKLGVWTRGGLSGREAVQLDAHLDQCADCRLVAGELADVNGTLRGVIAPAILGASAAGYLAAAGKASAAVSIASAAPWLGVAAATTAIVVAVSTGTTTPESAPPAVAATTTTTAANTPGQAGSSVVVTTSAGLTITTSTAPGVPAPGATSDPVNNPTAAPTGTATLVPTAPLGFETSTGGPPSELPISFRNTGSAPSAPLTLTVVLPDDIKTVGAGNVPAGSVGCPAGKDTITCSSGRSLAPGESVTFVLRVLAGPKATGGRLSATTGSVEVGVTVTITPKK